MSETATQTEGDQENPNLGMLRAKAERFDQAQAATAALRRENALLRSGLDLEHPLGQLFLKGYDGEFTAEALKAEAQKYGIPLKR